MPIIKVAGIQSASCAFDLAGSLAKVSKLTAAAVEEGAQFVVFPEAFVSGYPRHLGFQIGSRSEEDRVWYGRYVKSSIRVPDGAEGEDWLSTVSDLSEEDDHHGFYQLCKIAQTSNVHLSIGVVERSIIGSTLWCTNLLFSPEGRLLSKHRKLQPTAAERIVWSQGEAENPGGGDNLPVVKTSIGKIGGLICWENFMPLARYALYKKGVEIYTAPTADARDTWLPTMQHIAQEGRCFVISVNQFQTSQDFPADYPPLQQEGKQWSKGGSCIISPLGQILAGPLWEKEGIITADIDLDTLVGAKLDFDPVGHYARENVMMDTLNRLTGR